MRILQIENKKHKIHKKPKIEKANVISSSGGFKYNCPHYYKDNKFTIFLDWLQLTCTSSFQDCDALTEFTIDEYINDVAFKGGYTFVLAPMGTKHFKYRYDVFLRSQKVFDIQFIPRTSLTHEKYSCVVKFENHLLYGEYLKVWNHFQLHTKKVLNLEFVKISQFHIAIDGLNYLPHLVNDYIKGRYDIKLLGKSKMNANSFVRGKKIFEGFTFGNPKGDKIMSIYNKTKDIIRTNKTYIQEVHDLHLPNIETIYRCEMRLKHTFLKRLLKDDNQTEYTQFEILNLTTDSNFLLKVFNTASKHFFEFVYLDDSNITRCTKLQLFPNSSEKMKTTKKKYVGLLYKAKLSLHSTFKEVLLGHINVHLGLNYINRILFHYKLYDYYEIKKHQWLKEYKHLLNNDLFITEQQKIFRVDLLTSTSMFMQYYKDDNSLVFNSNESLEQ